MISFRRRNSGEYTCTMQTLALAERDDLGMMALYLFSFRSSSYNIISKVSRRVSRGVFLLHIFLVLKFAAVDICERTFIWKNRSTLIVSSRYSK